MKVITLFVAMMALVSCKQSSDYLYYRNDPAVVESKSYNIKEINSNSNLDVLIVIDNSGSMGSHQQSVIDNTSLFIDTFVQQTQLHWKIGIISTSESEKPYLGFNPGDELDYLTPDPVNKFKSAVMKLGTSGDGNEKAYDPIIGTFKNYPNFLRPNAALAIILITDAPEQSKMTTADFLTSLRLLGKNLSRVYFYGVLGPSEMCVCTDDDWKMVGSKFEELTKGLVSKIYPICDPRFGTNLVSIGQDIVAKVASPRVFLPSIPKVKTLKVLYRGREIPGGPSESGGYWFYEANINAIIFHDLSFAPGDQENVEIAYVPDDGFRY